MPLWGHLRSAIPPPGPALPNVEGWPCPVYFHGSLLRPVSVQVCVLPPEPWEPDLLGVPMYRTGVRAKAMTSARAWHVSLAAKQPWVCFHSGREGEALGHSGHKGSIEAKVRAKFFSRNAVSLDGYFISEWQSFERVGFLTNMPPSYMSKHSWGLYSQKSPCFCGFPSFMAALVELGQIANRTSFLKILWCWLSPIGFQVRGMLGTSASRYL